jgi:hypothetical protein
VKIPGNCKCCGAKLEEGTMRRYVEVCERQGFDPVERAMGADRPGIHCEACQLRVLSELVEDDHPGARRLVSRMRARALGLRVVGGGRG